MLLFTLEGQETSTLSQVTTEASFLPTSMVGIAAGLFCIIRATLGQQLRISSVHDSILCVLIETACPARDRGLDCMCKRTNPVLYLVVDGRYPNYFAACGRRMAFSSSVMVLYNEHEKFIIKQLESMIPSLII